jgi:hypothetical protein
MDRRGQREQHADRPRPRLHQIAILRHPGGRRSVPERDEHALPKSTAALPTEALLEKMNDGLEIGARDGTATKSERARSRDTYRRRHAAACRGAWRSRGFRGASGTGQDRIAGRSAGGGSRPRAGTCDRRGSRIGGRDRRTRGAKSLAKNSRIPRSDCCARENANACKEGLGHGAGSQ